MALELNPKDADVKGRIEDTRSHLSEVWDIDRDVPHGQEDQHTKRYKAWLNLTDAEFRAMQLDDRPAWADRPECDEILNRKMVESRGYACLCLKQEIKQARGLAVASGLVPATSLPGCSTMVQPNRLPVKYSEWALSWTDTPYRDRKTKLISHMVSVCENDSGAVMAMYTCLGTPGAGAVKNLLLTAMTSPLPAAPPPGRPQLLFVAHRLLPIYSKIAEMCRAWGIATTCETAAEAHQSAAQNDTDWQGYNNRERYRVQKEKALLASCKHDPGNGHKGEPTSTSSSSSRASTSSSSSRARGATSTTIQYNNTRGGGGLRGQRVVRPGAEVSSDGRADRAEESTTAAAGEGGEPPAKERNIRPSNEVQKPKSGGDSSNKKSSKKKKQAARAVQNEEVPTRVKQLGKQ